MKRRVILIAAIVATLMLCMAATPAFAYFTDHHTTGGGVVIDKPWPEQEEWAFGGKKHAIIKNTGKADAYVRVGFYASSAIPIMDVAKGDSWNGPEADDSWRGPSNGGWYYYNKVLKPGESTTEITAELNYHTNDKREVGENYNIIVTTEISPVKYDESGKNPSAVKWSHSYPAEG